MYWIRPGESGKFGCTFRCKNRYGSKYSCTYALKYHSTEARDQKRRRSVQLSWQRTGSFTDTVSAAYSQNSNNLQIARLSTAPPRVERARRISLRKPSPGDSDVHVRRAGGDLLELPNVDCTRRLTEMNGRTARKGRTVRIR